jgi:methyl-accepting chemotaxis protein
MFNDEDLQMPTTIQSKLLTAFGVLVALLLAIATLSYSALASVHQQFDQVVMHSMLRAKLSNDVIDAVNGRALEARNLVVAQSEAHKKRALERVKHWHSAVGQSLKALQVAANQGSASPEEQELIARIAEVEQRYAPLALAIAAAIQNGDVQGAMRQMNDDCLPLLQELLKAAQAHLALMSETATQQVAQETATFEQARGWLGAITGLGLAMALALSWAITRSIHAQLGAEPAALNEAVLKVAQGNLGPVRGAEHAPARSVLAALGMMQRDLADMVAQVRNTSDSIATGSQEIATGNADLSQRTEEQASNLQQTSASMMELTSTVQQNTETSRVASELASTASKTAKQGGEVVNHVVTTMQDIAGSSRKIADIISVIDGIAFQTNILALNAAVEAARAGEQGRGFAVVAGEVRTLAQRSAEAAREIRSLILASTERVEEGTQLVEQAGTSMQAIVEQVDKVAAMICDLSSTAMSQTTGIRQVTDAVGQLDQVTQQNAALVEESAAAAESLRHQATVLSTMVNRFQL